MKPMPTPLLTIWQDCLLGDEHAFPEKIDETALAALFLESLPHTLDRILEAREPPAGHAEDVEKLVPERLSLGAFGLLAHPFPGKSYGAIFDFTERQRHAKTILQIAIKCKEKRF